MKCHVEHPVRRVLEHEAPRTRSHGRDRLGIAEAANERTDFAGVLHDTRAPVLDERCVERLVAWYGPCDHHGSARGQGLAHGEASGFPDDDVRCREARGHVAFESDDLGADAASMRESAGRPAEGRGPPAHDGKLDALDALERADDRLDRTDPEAATRDQYAKGLAWGRFANAVEALECASHRNARRVDASGEAMRERIPSGSFSWDAQRIDPAFGPDRVGSIVSHHAHERRVEPPLPSSATQHDQGQMVRGDDRARRQRHHLVYEPGPRDVIEAPTHGLERPVTMVRREVGRSVELGKSALPGEVCAQVRLSEDLRRMLESVENDDRKPTLTGRLGGGERRGLVPPPTGECTTTRSGRMGPSKSKGRAAVEVHEMRALGALSGANVHGRIRRHLRRVCLTRAGGARRKSFHGRPRCARLGSFVEIHVDLNFDGNSLILSLVIGCVGFVCFVYGKRQQRFPQMLAGVVLSVYPYFVSNLILMAAIAVAILALLGVAIRLGI